MSLRSNSCLLALSAAFATALVSLTSAAQEEPPPPPPNAAAPAPAPMPGPAPEPPKKDKARFRGGIAAEGGGLLVPGIINFGLAGIQGQLGVQINNEMGVYVVPSFDIVFGSMGGIHVGAAALFEYSFLDGLLSVGGGPEYAGFAAFGAGVGEGGVNVAAAAGSFYGGRLHFGVQPVIGIGDNGIRRKALAIGVDLRFYGGGAGLASSGTAGASAKVADFAFAPTLSIGYTAF